VYKLYAVTMCKFISFENGLFSLAQSLPDVIKLLFFNLQLYSIIFCMNVVSVERLIFCLSLFFCDC